MKAINKFFVAILLLAMFGLSYSYTPVAFADDHEPETEEPAPEEAEPPVAEEIEEVGTVIDDIGYNALEIIIAMKDADVLVNRMTGVLDRYDGTGHPDDCEDFLLYYTFLDLYNLAFEIEFLFAPREWEDVIEITIDGTAKGLAASESIFWLCQNGKDDSISAFNLAAARAGLDEAHELIFSAVRSSSARIGVDPEAVPSSIAEVIDVRPSAEELEFIAELAGQPWDSEVFYEDQLITGELLNNIGGWLDRLINGETVGCGEYFIYVLLLSEPVTFIHVPDVWQYWYQEHLGVINQVFDSNKELIDICLNDGGSPSEFIVFKAREGVAQAVDRLHRVKQTTADRIGRTPQ